VSTHADETRAAAARIDHEWDEKALEWPITANSVVVECGGYKGRWALQMAKRYWPQLYVYEPQAWAAAVCREVLRPYGALVFDYGLGVRDETLPMASYETDGCTFVHGDGPLCLLRDAAAVLPPAIDVMLVNIEGYEYTLIPYFIEQGIHPRHLVVQFHTHADPDGSRMAQVYAALLTAGYEERWSYGPTLMAWRRR
jgi:hypothetical protein